MYINMCCPRDCVSRHNGGTSGAPLKPLRVDSALCICIYNIHLYVYIYYVSALYAVCKHEYWSRIIIKHFYAYRNITRRNYKILYTSSS